MVRTQKLDRMFALPTLMKLTALGISLGDTKAWATLKPD